MFIERVYSDWKRVGIRGVYQRRRRKLRPVGQKFFGRREDSHEGKKTMGKVKGTDRGEEEDV